jgi:hypothetical protein
MSTLLILPDGTEVPCRVRTYPSDVPNHRRATIQVSYKSFVKDEKDILAKAALYEKQGRRVLVIGDKCYDFTMHDYSIELFYNDPMGGWGWEPEPEQMQVIGFEIIINTLIRPIPQP